MWMKKDRSSREILDLFWTSSGDVWINGENSQTKRVHEACTEEIAWKQVYEHDSLSALLLQQK